MIKETEGHRPRRCYMSRCLTCNRSGRRQSWKAVVSLNGKSIPLNSAQPTFLSKGTNGAVDLEAVYAGMASEAEIKLGRDVKGKAVFFYSNDTGSRHVGISDNAIKRLSDRGAAAIFVILGVPLDEKTQFYPVNAPVPTFSLGTREGLAVRDLIGGAANEPVHLNLNLEVKMQPGLKSGTVWGTLKGLTDENVVVVAHRDGWFEGANDNGTGVATFLGLAEYFAKIPQSQRKRTIIFAGTDGHHDNGAESGVWFLEHPEFFAKTALLFNCEHTGLKDTGLGLSLYSNAPSTYRWYAGDSPALLKVATHALDAVRGADISGFAADARAGRRHVIISWRRQSRSSTRDTCGTRIKKTTRAYRFRAWRR